MYRVLKPGGIIGIRDVDYGGYLFAPDDETFGRGKAIFEADWENVGGHPRIGRQLGGLFYETGFIHVKVTASFEVHNDVESRRFYAQSINGMFSSADFIKRLTESGLSTIEEIDAIKDAALKWQEAPGAIVAIPHCEAIGRKAE